MASLQGMSDSSDRATALAALYQAERQDGATILVASLALIAAALTYLGVAAILINNSSLPGGAWVSAFLAFPLWVMTSYHVLLVGSALVRASSIEIIEKDMVNIIGLGPIRNRIGSRAGQRVINVAEQPRVLKIHTFVSYGGIGLIIVIFTAYCLTVAAKAEGWLSAPVISAGVVYIFLFVAALKAWIYVLGFAEEVKNSSLES